MGHLGSEVFRHVNEAFRGVAEAMADYYGGGLEGGVVGGDGYGAVSLSCCCGCHFDNTMCCGLLRCLVGAKSWIFFLGRKMTG